MRAKYPSAALVGITHSIGALLLGGAPNSAECTSFVFVCSHTGYLGDYRRRNRLPMAFLWHILMPPITRVVGYFPARRLGLGDDIPLGIALQWAARKSADLDYFATDVRTNAGLARCRSLHGDALVINVVDDAYATMTGTRRLLSYFPGLRVRHLQIGPRDAAVQRLGHFGFFRAPAKQSLWPQVVAHILLSRSYSLTAGTAV